MLLAYDTAFEPYSLTHGAGWMALQLRRADVSLESVAFDALGLVHVDAAEYVVIFCPGRRPVVPGVLAEVVKQGKKPVFWVGYGLEQLQEMASVRGRIEVKVELPEERATNVWFRGQPWAVPAFLWPPMAVAAGETNGVRLELPPLADGTRRPVCWQAGLLTVFSGVPGEGVLGHLLGELLLDFFGAGEAAPAHLYVRLLDYHPLSRHDLFLRQVDYLHYRGLPFMVAVAPACMDPATGRVYDLDSRPEFVSALRYAQLRGGRLVLSGCLRPVREGGEFWDTALDRPYDPDRGYYAGSCINRYLQQCWRHGLLPLAWTTPHYAASAAASREVAQRFSTVVERVQLSEATCQARHVPVGLTVDAYGRLVVPENLGFIPLKPADPNRPLRWDVPGERRWRGAVWGCDFHVYQPVAALMALADQVAGLGLPLLDLAELDHWVLSDAGVLLTGRARVSALLKPGPVRWRALDRNGRVLAEELLKDRTTQGESWSRRGRGEVELFEVMEDKP